MVVTDTVCEKYIVLLSEVQIQTLTSLLIRHTLQLWVRTSLILPGTDFKKKKMLQICCHCANLLLYHIPKALLWTEIQLVGVPHLVRPSAGLPTRFQV